MSLTLIGAGVSPYVRKVRVLLAEKNIPFEIDPMIPVNVSDEYKAISPLGKVPCLKDGDYALPDSSVICAYLERKYPDPPLYPAADADYGRALWFEEYADTKLVDSGIAIFREGVLAKAFFQREPEEEQIRKAIEEDMPQVLDYLAGQLGDAEYFVGNRFGIADIALAAPFVNFALGGYGIDAGRWPKLAAWLERVLGRPSYKPQIEEAQQMFAASS